MTLNRFFFLFLALLLIVYFGLNPYVMDKKTLEDIPQLEFKTFVSYEIQGEKLEAMIVGELAQRYETQFKIRDFAVYRESNNTMQAISAQAGIYEGKKLFLSESVQYQGKDNLILETEKANLDMEHNTLDIRAPFTLTQNGSVFTGSSLFFNQNNDKMMAKDIKASFIIK